VELDAEYRTLVAKQFRRHPHRVEPDAGCRVHDAKFFFMEATTMGRGLLLWLLGVPIPVILLLWLFFGR
jgi:hypothetical protein